MDNTQHSQDEELGILLFGRPPQTEDWLRDIRGRLSIMMLDVSTQELDQFLRSRLIERAAWIVPNHDKIIKSLDNRTDGFHQEIQRLRDVVERCGAFNQKGTTQTLRQAFEDDLELEAQEVRMEKDSFQAEMCELRGNLDPRVAPRFLQAQRMVEQSSAESGSERNSILREARGLLTEFTEGDGPTHPGIWLYAAWINWQISQNTSDVIHLLSKGTQKADPSLSSYFSLRFLAYFANQDGQYAKSLEYSKRALETRQTVDAFLESGLAAAALHDPATAKSHFEQALVMRGGSYFAILADERSLAAGSDALDVAVRVQLRLRRDGRNAISEWSNASKQIADAQKICGRSLAVPNELMEGHKTVLERLEKADLLTAGWICRQCSSNAKEVLALANRSLESEYAKRHEAMSDAKKMIETANQLRESRIETAIAQQDEAIRNSRRALATADAEAGRTQQGALLGLGSGCALFGLYVVSYAVLDARGVSVGLTTPVGMMASFVSAVPVVLAIIIQVRYSLKRFALDSKLSEATKAATQTCDQISKQADDMYREQVTQARKALETAEAEIKKVEGSARIVKRALSGSPQPTRVQAAKERAEKAKLAKELEEPVEADAA